MNLLSDIPLLEQKLRQQLPAANAHIKMAPEQRIEELINWKNYAPDAQKSAVTLLLFNEAEDTNIIFIRRNDYNGVHSGQIGLPGGKFENYDENTLQTAKRETFEEIGVVPEKYKVIGKLSPLYVGVSNFLIEPYLAVLPEKPIFSPDTYEVKKIEIVHLSDFYNNDNVHYKNFTAYGSSHSIHAPYYKIQNLDIWGATAMIMSEFIDIFPS